MEDPRKARHELAGRWRMKEIDMLLDGRGSVIHCIAGTVGGAPLRSLVTLDAGRDDRWFVGRLPDFTVVNEALPVRGTELGATTSGL